MNDLIKETLRYLKDDNYSFNEALRYANLENDSVKEIKIYKKYWKSIQND